MGKEVKEWILPQPLMSVVAGDVVAGGTMIPEDSAIVVFGVVGAAATDLTASEVRRWEGSATSGVFSLCIIAQLSGCVSPSRPYSPTS